MTDWPHTPPHRLLQKGTYMVTSATYQKIHYFKTMEDLQFLHHSLLAFSNQYN
ncbi:MAG: hypothetical protein Q8K60_08280 [Parachlamydiaceae bacterium]|nr:hypothetical protein [Parachlamydiaceae bacterium]